MPATTQQSSGGQFTKSPGNLDFGPTLFGHEDLTPALIPLEDIPFNQLDWPNPAGRKYLMTSIASRPVDDADIPFAQRDWPIPILARKIALTWVNNNINDVLAPVQVNPHIPLEWPNPQPRKAPATITWINSNNNNILSNPFNQNDWPNPASKLLKSQTWVQNLLQNTLTPTVIQLPPGGIEFTIPKRKPFIMVSIASSPNISPAEMPTPRSVQPIYLVRKPFILTWANTRPFDAGTKPFNQNEWPNPLRKTRMAQTWINPRTQDPDATQFIPCSVTEWDVPPPRKRPALTWLSSIPQLQQLFTSPLGRQWIDTPVLKRKSMGMTYVNPKPFFYVDQIQTPLNNLDWPNPVVRKSTLIISHVQRFTTPITPGDPFSRQDWPNVARRKRMNPSYIFYYQQDDNTPRPVEHLSLPPQSRRRANEGYIFSPRLDSALVSDPLHNVDWPNPIIVKRHPLTIINNLLPVLDPGPGQKPFHQDEWPNPQVGKRNFHSGWIQNKPTYYTEEPLIPAQYDWPVFRPVRRNGVGYVFAQKQFEEPRFNTVDAVPPQRRVSNPSWIFSSLFDLVSIVGIKPFNQLDWPNPQRKRVNYQILQILQGLGIQLPNVVGREICLEWEDTEYYLFCGEEEYELEWMDTEYYLNADGNDCE